MNNVHIQKALRKIAGVDDNYLAAGIGAAALGIPAAIIDYIQSDSDPLLRKSKVKRIAKAIAKGVMWGGGGAIAGIGVNRLANLSDKVSQQGSLPLNINGSLAITGGHPLYDSPVRVAGSQSSWEKPIVVNAGL